MYLKFPDFVDSESMEYMEGQKNNNPKKEKIEEMARFTTTEMVCGCQ